MTYRLQCYIHGGPKVLLEDDPIPGTCRHEQCEKLRALPDPETPLFKGMIRLRQQNADGWTDNEMKKDIYESARRDGRDIQRAR